MKRLLLLSLLLAAALCARAQAPADTTAAFAVEALASEIEALKSKASTWEKIRAHLPHVSGYVQAGYEWSENASTFFVKRVRLNLTGDIVPKLDYRIQVEFVSPKLVDAYVQYRPFTQLNVKLGQYKIPFSIENTDYAPLQVELIEYPLPLRKLMGFSDLCGLAATGRDLGATLWGGFFRRDGYCVVNYDLGVYNGEGINTRDRNKSKDIAARLMLRPMRGLLLSGSYYRGEYGAGCLRRDRYGAGACYDRGAVVVRGEWIGGTTGRATAEGIPAGRYDSSGWYVLGGWRATRSLMPVVRCESLLADVSRHDSRQTDYTAGLVWQPYKYLRCQLNYTYEDYAARDIANRNVVAVMLTGAF